MRGHTHAVALFSFDAGFFVRENSDRGRSKLNQLRSDHGEACTNVFDSANTQARPIPAITE